MELAAQARLRERVPLLLEPSEIQLVKALREGQPVLLLLNLGVRSYPLWHYAALTGYDPIEGYTLNNGKAKPETVARGQFLRQWNWADRWAMTLHAPAEPPTYADAARWIAAAAPLQRNAPQAAEKAYRAAVQRWPEFLYEPCTASELASSRSASSMTMIGSLPPSSSTTRR